MSALAEQTLIQHLTDDDSIAILAKEGLDEECLPTEALREVYLWAMDVYFRGGRTMAPSVAVMQNEWGDLLSDYEVDIEEEPEGTIEWAIDDLKGSFLYKETQSFNKRLAAEMSDANTMERMEIVREFSTEFVALANQMESHESRVDVRVGLHDRLDEYHRRAADKEFIYGMRFGLDEIDSYTRGIRPGELAVVAGGPKVGKSYFMARAALREWQSGKTVVLFTLELDVETIQDRIACLACNVEARAFLHGTCTPEETDKVKRFADEMRDFEFPLHVIQPPPRQRSAESLVRQAQLLGADTLLIDQLTFMEPEDERAPRPLQIREMMHTLKIMISTGRERMPCLLAHQISREGVRQADKVGYLRIDHFAEGSEVERTADWGFGLHRSEAERTSLKAKFQTLAARREDTRHFMLTWSIDTGYVNVRYEFDLETGRALDQEGMQ